MNGRLCGLKQPAIHGILLLDPYDWRRLGIREDRLTRVDRGQITKGGEVQLSRIRILPAITALILTFAVLFGGLQVYRTYEVVQPLESQLAKIPAVQSVHVATGAQTPTITITLGKVPDLQNTYTLIESEVTSILGGPMNIVLKDHRTPALAAAYESMQQILFQGIAHGSYVTMISQLEQAAAKAHITCRVSMNNQDIFIQMAQKGAYLYGIVPYTIKASGVNG